MKTVLLIEPMTSASVLIDACWRRGFRVVVATAENGGRTVAGTDREAVDRLLAVDTNDENQLTKVVRETHEEEGFAAVIPGHEYYVEAACKVADRLGLPSLPVHTAAHFRRKDKMRETLEHSGIRAPRHAVVETSDELDGAIEHVGFPCVVKPVDRSGSSLVRLCSTKVEVRAAVREIHENPFNGYVQRQGSRASLLEEMVTGPEYSVEGYVGSAGPVCCSITEKWTGGRSQFVERGHISSPDLAISTSDEVVAYVERSVEALGLTVGVFHAEIRLSDEGPQLMEVGARLPGDHIVEITELARGINLADAMVQAYIGELCDAVPVKSVSRPVRYAGVLFFIRPGLDMYRAAQGLDVLRGMDGFVSCSIDYGPGDPIPPDSNSAGRIGHAIFCNSSYERVREAMIEADREVVFE